MSESTKSIITCDLEGRIETFSDGAEALFGWKKEEIVGKKRVSLFSPGLVVLGHVGTWLARAVSDGEYSTRTVFLRRDGTRFAARIRITPTYRNKQHIGYCGVTTPLEWITPDEAMPRVSPFVHLFRWLVVTRAPFLTATLVPLLVAAAFVAHGGRPFPGALFALATIGALALHVAANTFNDYFDWRSGADQGNNDYFLPFSGGSRSIELGLISERGLLAVAVGALAVAALIGGALAIQAGPGILGFGAAGAFAALFYTAPPIRLAARKGAGELFVGLCFGPLLTAGTIYALTGEIGWMSFALGVPAGLWTTAILWINEFPDAASDERAGKKHLVAVLGLRAARWGYLALLTGAFAAVVAGVVLHLLPPLALAPLAALPLALYAATVTFRHYGDRTLVRANRATIQLHLVAGLLMAAGIYWA